MSGIEDLLLPSLLLVYPEALALLGENRLFKLLCHGPHSSSRVLCPFGAHLFGGGWRRRCDPASFLLNFLARSLIFSHRTDGLAPSILFLLFFISAIRFAHGRCLLRPSFPASDDNDGPGRHHVVFCALSFVRFEDSVSHANANMLYLLSSNPFSRSSLPSHRRDLGPPHRPFSSFLCSLTSLERDGSRASLPCTFILIDLYLLGSRATFPPFQFPRRCICTPSPSHSNL